MNLNPMSLSRDQRWPHTEVDLRILPSHSFFIKAIFQKAERGERTHSSSEPHSGKQLRINRDTVKGIESHPWTNLKTNSVRFLNNAQQRNKSSEDRLAYEES